MSSVGASASPSACCPPRPPPGPRPNCERSLSASVKSILEGVAAMVTSLRAVVNPNISTVTVQGPGVMPSI